MFTIPRPRFRFLGNFLDGVLDDFIDDDAGMTTEYALLTIVAAGAAIVLWRVVQGASFEDGLSGLISDALSFNR